jgi:putative oxidoreductase
MKLGRLILRIVVGGYFFGHGAQKLFGWFGGHGPDATGQFFENLGLRPGKRHALAAATPIGAAVLIATMLTAINRVHLKNGPWVTNGGYEYNLVLIAALLALAETGPGGPSIDSARGGGLTGNKAALLAAILGTLGAAGAHIAAENAPAAQPATPAQEPAPAPDTATAAV